MPIFETDDHCRIYYETYGFEEANPTIVFLNGTTQTTLYWLPLAKKLKDRFRVVLYDARGQGKSGLGQTSLCLQIHVDDLSGLLDAIGPDRVHLVGLSHGAQVACALAAAKHPLVDKLVICSLGAEHDKYVLAVMHAWQKALAAGGVAAMAWASLPVVFGRDYLAKHARWLDKTVAAITSRNDRRHLERFLAAMPDYPAPAEFAPRIKAPSLVLSGADDPLVTRSNAKRLAMLCAGRHLVFEHTGHSIPAEAPDAFQSTLLEYLSD